MAFPVFCYRVNQENHVSFEREYLGLSQLFNIRLPGGGYKSMSVVPDQKPCTNLSGMDSCQGKVGESNGVYYPGTL